jgi:hypothetical protein
MLLHVIDTGTLLSFLLGIVLPILVGAVTKVTTHPAIKGAALLLLSGVTGALSQWLDALNSNTPFLWQSVVLSALLAFVMGVASHTAILQHTSLSSTGTPFGTPRAAVQPDGSYVVTDLDPTADTGVGYAAPLPGHPDYGQSAVVGIPAAPSLTSPAEPAPRVGSAGTG